MRKISSRVAEKAKKICSAKSVFKFNFLPSTITSLFQFHLYYLLHGFQIEYINFILTNLKFPYPNSNGLTLEIRIVPEGVII